MDEDEASPFLPSVLQSMNPLDEDCRSRGTLKYLPTSPSVVLIFFMESSDGRILGQTRITAHERKMGAKASGEEASRKFEPGNWIALSLT
ncbi:hypothetical protein EGR_05688 [Echinococcus granulosus]|uniref:Uncharacterized protein n=1 Tax=Echinococcus granulosus TaxID=6210 RepID=W6UMU3_ECHGR|nr:hypothetical protein EGR_05688 [Echinococcus granulosus]EUB59437.1 hypothetical protein EGR_05688 [Echinococcus granulosus]